MNEEEKGQTKLRELDLLKSILETEQANDTGFVSSSSGRSSRMGDYSQAENHAKLSLTADRIPGRPKSGRKTLSQRRYSEDDFVRMNVNIRSDGEYSDFIESPRSDTIHLQHGINYTPLIKRSPRSPRRVTSAKPDPQRVQQPDKLDPLFLKYAELQEMLSADVPNKKIRPILDPHLTRKAQHLMLEYKLSQSGHIPIAWLNSRGVSLPNIGKKRGKGRKSKFPKALHSGRQTLNFATQTPQSSTAEEERYDEDNSYVLIDATNKEQVKTRRVTFANERANCDTDAAEIEKQYGARGILRGRPYSAPTYRSRPLVKNTYKGRKIKPKPKTLKAIPVKPKTNLVGKNSPKSNSTRISSHSPRNKKSSRSSSSDSSPRRTKHRKSSSSSDSRSRSRSSSRSSSGKRYSYSSPSSRSSSDSRSRSRSPKVKLDDQLKTSENQKILDWLKEKNKECRMMRKLKRKEAKERLKIKQEEEEKKQQRLEKSEIAVKQWMEAKTRELRAAKKSTAKKNSKEAELDHSFQSTSSQEKYENIKPVLKSEVMKSSRPKTGKTRAKKVQDEEDKKLDENETELKKRLSYDEWLSTKRKEDEDKMKKALKEKENKLRNSDPEEEEIIKQVGQNRIKNIRNRKKRIDTGVEDIDKAANAVFGDETSENFKEVKDKEPRYHLTLNEGEYKKQKKVKQKRGKGELSAAHKPIQISTKAKPVPPSVPKPKIKSDRKQKVKHTQKSWDEFSDYVWSKLNETDGDMERPEPQGSDKPDIDPHLDSSDSSSTGSKQSDDASQNEESTSQGEKSEGNERSNSVPQEDKTEENEEHNRRSEEEKMKIEENEEHRRDSDEDNNNETLKENNSDEKEGPNSSLDVNQTEENKEHTESSEESSSIENEKYDETLKEDKSEDNEERHSNLEGDKPENNEEHNKDSDEDQNEDNEKHNKEQEEENGLANEEKNDNFLDGNTELKVNREIVSDSDTSEPTEDKEQQREVEDKFDQEPIESPQEETNSDSSQMVKDNHVRQGDERSPTAEGNTEENNFTFLTENI